MIKGFSDSVVNYLPTTILAIRFASARHACRATYSEACSSVSLPLSTMASMSDCEYLQRTIDDTTDGQSIALSSMPSQPSSARSRSRTTRQKQRTPLTPLVRGGPFQSASRVPEACGCSRWFQGEVSSTKCSEQSEQHKVQ